MRIVRYVRKGDVPARPRLGIMIGERLVGDLRGAYARLLADKGDGLASDIAKARVPDDLGRFISGGTAANDVLKACHEKLSSLAERAPDAPAPDGRPLLTALTQCELKAPLPAPSKFIAVGRNYGRHLAEMKRVIPFAVPSAWIKANSTILDPTADIVKPKATDELDYETELTLVIGPRCKHISEENAYDAIFGYTVASDITARDIVRIEREEGNQLFGKMFDSFAPMGPWVVTADEIKDPMDLMLRTRVNGQIRQNSSTSGMTWNIRQLLCFLSQMTLEPGDAVMTGTPEGVARGHKPLSENWFLKPGDVLESEVEGVGTMRNRIVEDPLAKPHWPWPAAPVFKGGGGGG